MELIFQITDLVQQHKIPEARALLQRVEREARLAGFVEVDGCECKSLEDLPIADKKCWWCRKREVLEGECQ